MSLLGSLFGRIAPFSLKPLRGGGRWTRSSFAIRDLSEQKRAEERLRQADRLSSIGTLAAGLGHDMNNILLPVRARLDVLERSELPSDVREHLAEIRNAARYLQNLADGLHLLALDPKDSDASSETTDINEWWRQTSVLLSRALPKDVRFSTSLPTALPRIPVAPHRLTQAVLNLLVNAAKAVSAGCKVRLWAELHDSGRLVRLAVADDGCGMDEVVRRRALEPFFTTKRRGLGTGLGLSLVHGVVQQAGGTISIESRIGEGTTISMEFPAVDALVESTAERVATENEQSLTAIVSLDEPRIASLVTSLLEISGFEVERRARTPRLEEEVALWVVDGRNEFGATAHKYLGANRWVIILGHVARKRMGDRVTIIDDPNDFVSIRAAMERVLAQHRGDS